MSIQYDTSGNLNFPYDSIINIGGYKYQPILTLSSFISLSGLVFPINIKPPIYYSGGIMPTTISGRIIYLKTSDFYTDIISNRMKSTFLNGFLTISGNINFKNNGSINNCQNFNGLPTSFNQNVTFNNNTYFNKSISLNSNRLLLRSPTDNAHFLGFSDPSIDGPTLRGWGAVCLAYRNNETACVIDINGLTVKTGNIILNSVVLTSPMISNISNVNSDVQQQFNTISGLIYTNLIYQNNINNYNTNMLLNLSNTNRPIPFIWLKFDTGDVTNTTTLKNYGSQGIDATLQKIGTGAYPILTTGQSIGTACISLVGQTNTQNGGYISIAPITTTTNGLTFAVWFKFQPNTTMIQYTRLFDFGNAPNTNDLIAYFNDYSSLFSNIGGTQVVENYNLPFNTGEWFHYAFTIKPNGEWNVYINGTFITTQIISYPAVKTLNVNDLGKSKYTEPLLTAQLDDFRFYNVPLSSDDVMALYNKTYDTKIFVNSDVQQQFNTISSSIYNIKNNVPFLDSYTNVFTGLNTFINNSVYFGINQYNSINGESDNFQIKGYKQIQLYLSSLNLSIASITNTGITINTGNLQIGTNSLTSSMISYLSNDVQNQFNTLSSQIYSNSNNHNRNTLIFNSSSVTYTNTQIGNNQFIIYTGFSDLTLTLPSNNSLRSGQIINISNTQNVQTVANGNFIYPLILSSYSYVDSLPSWTITGYSVIVQQSTSPFFPTGNLPSGPNYIQSIAIQRGSTTVSISQNVYLNTGVSTLSFYAGPRQSPNYSVSNYFNVTIGSTTVISNTTFTANQNWTLYTVNYSAPNVGNYNLIITSGGGSGDSSINFANITIVTPNNNRILTINALDYVPNLNGFNNGEFLSTSNILLQKNESVMLINDGKNYTKAFTNVSSTSGTTLQTRTFSSKNYLLTNRTISTQAEIFGYDFTPKSSNSSIYVTFDCYASIGGAGTNDIFQARLLIGNLQCGYKDILVPDYQRNRASSLFPISGHRMNTALSAFRIVVDAARLSGDDVIDISSPAWSCLITEIQN